MATSNSQRLLLLAFIAGAVWSAVDMRVADANTERLLRVAAQAATRTRLQLAAGARATTITPSAAKEDGPPASPSERPPNHSRLMRMLRCVDADRRRLGPSDPDRASRWYATAALGTHPELFGDPDYARATETIEAYELGSEDAPFFAHLGYTATESTRLATLLAEARVSPGEAYAVALSDGLGEPQAKIAGGNASSEIQKEIAEVISPADQASLQTYSKGQYLASQLQLALAGSGNALTNEQFVSLAMVVGNEEPRMLLEGTISDEGLARASTFLTPAQTSTLQFFLSNRQP